MIKIVRLLVLTLLLVLNATELLATTEPSRIGKVTEIKIVGKYIYLKLDEQEKETWLATLKLKVSPGDEVEYLGGDIMENFHSKALDKTFESIRFVTRIRVLNDDNAPTANAMPSDSYHKNVANNKQADPVPVNIDVTPAEGGKTILEILTSGDKIAGEKVVLRAQAVKVNNNILGRNWITLQDGTGSAPDDKIIATTSETITVGEVFTIQGIVKTDVDLGGGYRYKVLLEEARFTQ